MDETYRMLGREHEADLAREAAKWHLADKARGVKRAPAVRRPLARKRLDPGQRAVVVLARIARGMLL